MVRGKSIINHRNIHNRREISRNIYIFMSNDSIAKFEMKNFRVA